MEALYKILWEYMPYNLSGPHRVSRSRNIYVGIFVIGKVEAYEETRAVDPDWFIEIIKKTSTLLLAYSIYRNELRTYDLLLKLV